LTRLDQNRAVYQLAARARANVQDVTNVTIWGNHSPTQVVDFTHAKISGKQAIDVIHDRKWLENEFSSIVQKRGAEVIICAENRQRFRLQKRFSIACTRS